MNAESITLEEWAKGAAHSCCKDNKLFLKQAVDLSLMLSKALNDLIDVEAVELQDIRSENVLVFVERLDAATKVSKTLDGLHYDNGLGSMKAWAVLFECDPPLPGLESNPEPLDPSAVCTALGKILLEIFSNGPTSAMLHSAPSVNGYQNGDALPSGVNKDSSWMQAMNGKRKSIMACSSSNKKGSISDQSNSALTSLGMPRSICQLVKDLLLDAKDDSQQHRITSLYEAILDLTRMNNEPAKFLFDRTCPQKALEDAGLVGGYSYDEHNLLFGREKHIDALMGTMKRVSAQTQFDTIGSATAEWGETSISQNMNNNFLCEVAFLSGYAGSGKTALCNTLINKCEEERWFTFYCKFEKQTEPMTVMARGFNDFFGRWGGIATASTTGHGGNKNQDINYVDPAMRESFGLVCQTILSTIGNEGISQLCDIVPNFARIFPSVTTTADTQSASPGISSIDNLGCASKRRLYLLHRLFFSLCSAGRPVLVTLDDLQWGSFAMEVLADFVANFIDDVGGGDGSVQQNNIGMCRRGMLFVGTYRSNEVVDGDFSKKMDIIMQSTANVTAVSVGELSIGDTTNLLSTKLALPTRYTQQLASLVQMKTRGNPLFVIQFLRTIVQNGMLTFSVKTRCWEYDLEIIDMQMISDDVANLISYSFHQLPPQLIETLQIVSCICTGSQTITSSLIDLINDEKNPIVPYDMLKELQQALSEGILQKAGPIYMFTHDLVQETIYKLIPAPSRALLHKKIGLILLSSAENNTGVNHINIYCQISTLNSEERLHYAESNVKAAKLAIASCSFEQARLYIDAGMRMLDPQHWDTQYSLSLRLFELSASVSCMQGDIDTMSTCLGEVLSNAKTLEDSLTSSSLLVKLLASASNFRDAIFNCFDILSNLGEDFPRDPTTSTVSDMLVTMEPTLRKISSEQVKMLPLMTDKSKLSSMKFLSMLCTYSIISKPMLVPILSCRMVNLTLQYGFCEDSIVGIVMAGYGVFTCTDNTQLGYRLGKIGESLIEISSNKHALRSRLCFQLEGVLKLQVEPAQSVVALFPDLYSSGIMSGDIQSAMLSLGTYCSAIFYTATEDLNSLTKKYIMCTNQAVKYQQNAVLLAAMSTFRTCLYLSGNSNDNFRVKSFEELNEIGAETNNSLLLWHNFVSECSRLFYMKDYKSLVALSESCQPSQHKRIMNDLRILWEGIAALKLARDDPHEPKWRILGKNAFEHMTSLAETRSEWNYENKAKLLQAELHYLDGNLDAAEACYMSSIKAAREHKFLNEEAVALELYGMFCLENHMVYHGGEQLRMALEKYKKWGAMKKAEDLQLYIDIECCVQNHFNINPN